MRQLWCNSENNAAHAAATLQRVAEDAELRSRAHGTFLECTLNFGSLTTAPRRKLYRVSKSNHTENLAESQT